MIQRLTNLLAGTSHPGDELTGRDWAKCQAGFLALKLLCLVGDAPDGFMLSFGISLLAICS